MPECEAAEKKVSCKVHLCAKSLSTYHTEGSGHARLGRGGGGGRAGEGVWRHVVLDQKLNGSEHWVKLVQTSLLRRRGKAWQNTKVP